MKNIRKKIQHVNRYSIWVSFYENSIPNLSRVPSKYRNEVHQLAHHLMNPYHPSHRWEPPKSCSDCGGGIGSQGCSGVCIDGRKKRKKWEIKISWPIG